MSKSLLHISQNEDGMFSISTEFDYSELNGLSLIKGIELALTYSSMQAFEAVKCLLLAFLGASEYLDSPKEKPKPKRLRDIESSNPGLLKALSEWRRTKAREKEVPQYYIMSNRVMLAISEAIPFTKDELLSINGFGKVMLERYGDELLEITQSYFDDDQL